MDILNTAVWKIRSSEQSTFSSDPTVITSEVASFQNSMKIHHPGKSIQLVQSIDKVVDGIDKLKIIRKRGRPNKKFGNMPVKAFQIPGIFGNQSLRKIKMNSSRSNSGKKDAWSEAHKILETGRLMGLVVEGTEAEALDNIVKRI